MTADDIKLLDCSRCGTACLGQSHRHEYLTLRKSYGVPPLVGSMKFETLTHAGHLLEHYRPLCADCTKADVARNIADEN